MRKTKVKYSGPRLEEIRLNDTTLKIIMETCIFPGHFLVGVSYGKGLNWSFGTEFGFQDWSSFESVNDDDEGLDARPGELRLGGEFTMDPLCR